MIHYTPRNLLLALCLIACTYSTLHAQTARRSLAVSRIEQPIVIDGKLDEAAWNSAEKATGFTVYAPNLGDPSHHESEVSVLYDDNAVYIGATLYDPHPDSILKQLSSRDEYEYNNTDAFGVNFDTYADQQNGFAFIVTAAGVQADAKIIGSSFDYSWNAAWYAKVTQDEEGWHVEMKLPYSALRFPKCDQQKWRANFFRTFRRTREKSYWNAVYPNVANFLSQGGDLLGVKNIKSPIRLALLPYISSYAEHYDKDWSRTLNGGLDIKYGLNEGFTLDMTLVPDFGQTLFDNKVLNLSPIEVRYDERRYFFTEGVDLFNKNDLFYSRRVGGIPVNSSQLYQGDNGLLNTNEIVTQNPATTKLYNATKISGRTKGKLGIGVFNALSAPTYATVLDTLTRMERKQLISPLANYSVVVLDQIIGKYSSIGLVNTNVSRRKESYDANVTALLFRMANKTNKYAISGSADISQLMKTDHNDVGFRYYLGLAKVNGNFTWNLSTKNISDRFNPNDLGYLDRNNLTYYDLSTYINRYKPFWKINIIYNTFNVRYSRVYNPNDFQTFGVTANHSIILKSFDATGFYYGASPFTSNDYFEPRKPGRFYLLPASGYIGYFFSTDYRKKFALDGDINQTWFKEDGRMTFYRSISPRYRFNDHFNLVYSLSLNTSFNNVGFVNNVNDSIYLGRRDVHTVISQLTGAYIFKSNMALKLNARHYWSQAEYSRYYLLAGDGNILNTAYNTNHNVNFNTFNIFLNYVWQFKPGSELSLVYQNSIYSRGSSIISQYDQNLQNTFQLPQSNSLSFKLIYFLDYLNLQQAVKKRSLQYL